jgi:hypothetical protein
MRRLALGVRVAIPVSMLVFCGPPPQTPMQPPGPPVAEPAPPSAGPLTPGLDTGGEHGHDAGANSSQSVDASYAGDSDAALRPHHGGLSPDQIRNVVVAQREALHACYESEAQKNPTFRGSVTLAWTTDASGAVTSAKITASTLHNPRAEDCILRQVRSWHFPSSDGASQVDAFPLSFGVGR